MSLGKWERDTYDIVADRAAPITGALIEVRREDTGVLAAVFADRDGIVPLGNPFIAPGSGPIFYAAYATRYRITITKAGYTRTLRDEAVTTPPITEFSQLILGSASADDLLLLQNATTLGKALLTALNASAALTTLGVSSFIQTLLDDANAAAARTTIDAQQTLGFTPENVANKDTDGTLAANSDVKYPSQKAVKTYADQLIASADAMVFKGVIDASTNPNYPAADRGATYRISVAGKIGGASGLNVEVGDLIICLTDGTASGNQATVGAAWTIVQTNLDGAVVGPASVTDSNFAQFDGTTGKLLKGGLSLDTDTTLAANSATRVASQSAVKAYADAVTAASTHAATAKATPVDADELPLADSAASFALKKLTWADLKATLKTYFDSLTTTLTNKRITPRVSTTASSATPTPNADTDDEYTVTALAVAATFGAPTGTPTQGQKLVIRVKDNATARTLAWNAIYRAVGVTLPTTTVISKTLYVGFIYNATDTKWDAVAVAQE